jgi:hypothetical protein
MGFFAPNRHFSGRIDFTEQEYSLPALALKGKGYD